MALTGVLALPAVTLLDTQTARHAVDYGKGSSQLSVVGVQMEFPVELEVPGILDAALAQCPKAELFMLSEYTFDGPVPKRVKDWCRKNKRYLLAGGKDIVGSSDFYDTAFVIGPSGEVVFQQAKSVPIQFFKDGFPAKKQQVWSSPWGKLGICICYDLSYSRVTDALVRQGAQGLLVPTMDVIDWGKHEHELHSRVGPFRAAEYGLPILRVASSGVSQLIDKSGAVTCSAPFPQQSQVIFGELNLPMNGHLPLDRFLASFATGLTGILIGWLVASSIWSKVGSHFGFWSQIRMHGWLSGKTISKAKELKARLKSSLPRRLHPHLPPLPQLARPDATSRHKPPLGSQPRWLWSLAPGPTPLMDCARGLFQRSDPGKRFRPWS
jgi:hypothetical protein